MAHEIRERRTGWTVALLGVAFGWTASGAAITKTVDRKFPEGLCPIETRAAAGVDLSFVAPAPTVRITFAVDNFTGGSHNFTHLDNVVVVQKSVFDAHRLVSPGFEGCYDPNLIPPGQSSGGMLNAPAYDFDAAATPEVLVDLFATDASGWAGTYVYHDPAVTAPTEPATGNGFDGGSLGLGHDDDGDVVVRASKTVSGLTPGGEYVVSAWWSTFQTPTLSVTIDAPCLDADADGFVDCDASCDLQPGQACGDCNDQDPVVHHGLPDDTCDGVDNDCDGQTDEGFSAGCLCTMPPSNLADWWPAEGSGSDARGESAALLHNGVSYASGRVGQAFSFDGIDDYVDTGSAPQFDIQNSGVFTIAAWIRLNDSNAVAQHAITATTVTTIQKGHFFLWDNLTGERRLRLGLTDGTSGVPIIDSVGPPNAINDNAWHHVAVVGDGIHVRFYVDGTGSAGSGTFGAFTSGASAYPLNIGRCPYTSPQCQFAGQIDEVQVYTRALGSAEVRALFDAGSAPLCRCVTDADADGYQLGSQGLTCPAGTEEDCDDSQSSIHPGAPETCNGLDDDCDGALDEGLAQSAFYADGDSDGFGAASTTLQACAAPPGYVSDGSDCDDDDASVHPGASDAVCDGVDQNCNGTADDEFTSPPNGWIATPLTGAPSGRRLATMVSTGDRVIVWGGLGASTNEGGIYRPRDAATDEWTPTQTTNAPSARYYHTAVWTGTDMIVWGGITGGNTGGVYNLSTNTWSATTTTGAPTARDRHTAVWNGTHMIVWGGSNTNTGAAYLPGPFGGSWSALPTTGAPAGRSGHTAVWTGDLMVVWGGLQVSLYLNNGGRYSPAANAWLPMAVAPIVGRWRHTVVWTGSRMIVWGGYNGVSYLGDGAIYDPQTDQWAPITATGPSARAGHTAVWDAARQVMVIWGGQGPGFLNDGWAYDPLAGTWTPLPTVGAPTARYEHAAAWLAATHEMIVWGGGTVTPTNTGARIVDAPSACGVGGCARESSYTCTAGQLGYGACTPGAPTAETCNGIDDDCDDVIDEGAAPAGNPSVAAVFDPVYLGSNPALFWTGVPDATAYDVVGGNLATLRGTGGDFSAAIDQCLVDDGPDTFFVIPPGVDGVFLVRAVNACGVGSYDVGPGQQGSRDAEIDAAPAACP